MFIFVLLYVFTFLVRCCDVRFEVRIKTMFDSSLPLVVCRRAHPRVSLGSVLLIYVVFCVVFFVLFVFVLCLVCPILSISLNCPFLITLRISLTFIVLLYNTISISYHKVVLIIIFLYFNSKVGVLQ